LNTHGAASVRQVVQTPALSPLGTSGLSVLSLRHHPTTHRPVTVTRGSRRPRVQRRCWKRRFNVDAFTADLLDPDLAVSRPVDVSELFNCYNTTLTRLVDLRAPVVTVTSYSRPATPWFDRDRHLAKVKTRRPASADKTARRQFQPTGQPVSRTQASDAMTSRLPRYEAKCVQHTRFQWGSVPLRSDINGTALPLPIY